MSQQEFRSMRRIELKTSVKEDGERLRSCRWRMRKKRKSESHIRARKLVVGEKGLREKGRRVHCKEMLAIFPSPAGMSLTQTLPRRE
jgi:hypothetical protein